MPEQGTGVCRVSVLLSVSFRAILGPFIPFGRVLLFGRAWPFFRANFAQGALSLLVCLLLFVARPQSGIAQTRRGPVCR